MDSEPSAPPSCPAPTNLTRYDFIAVSSLDAENGIGISMMVGRTAQRAYLAQHSLWLPDGRPHSLWPMSTARRTERAHEQEATPAAKRGRMAPLRRSLLIEFAAVDMGADATLSERQSPRPTHRSVLDW